MVAREIDDTVDEDLRETRLGYTSRDDTRDTTGCGNGDSALCTCGESLEQTLRRQAVLLVEEADCDSRVLTAIFLAIESTKAVLPIAGRAAIMMRSEFCQPDVSLSRS